MKHLITPDAPFSFVADDIAIGGILAYGQDISRFGLCINVAYELVATGGRIRYDIKGVPLLEFRLDDTSNRAEHAAQIPEVLRAVEMLRQARAAHKTVLVTCAQGRNRSALVVAEFLVQCGNRPREVVRKIQERRSRSLTNPIFVEWLGRAR